MSEIVGWACKDCEATGETAGEAAAHLKDGDLDGDHTVVFLDADGLETGEVSATDLEAPGDPETEPAPTEPEPDTEPAESLELGPVDAAQLAYIQAVINERGPDLPIFPCRVCEGRGWRTNHLLRPDDIGPCERCGGQGIIDTGSAVPGEIENMCTTCGGKGWRTLATVAQLPAAGPAVPSPPGLPQAPPGYAWADGGVELVKIG
jgi:hypothetical protein